MEYPMSLISINGEIMKNSKQTSKSIASQASEVLRDPSSSKIAKSLAASALAQANTDKQTSSEMETIASQVQKSEKYSDLTYSLAGSVLSQSNKKR
jgi:hypothetical protein